MVDNADAQAPQAFWQSWGGAASNRDYSRFNHYPYVYYPQNYWVVTTLRVAIALLSLPTGNADSGLQSQVRNEYPSPRRYHWGHHFITDVF